jgi:DNA-binding NarL/FixJ family response regulator
MKLVPEDRIRIIVVDDSALFRHLIRDVLKELPEVSIIGNAENGRQALDQIRERRPDLITLDVEMPDIVGDHIGYAIKRAHPELRVVYLSDHDESTLRAMSERTGTDGFIRKSSDPEQLLDDIESELSRGAAG